MKLNNSVRLIGRVTKTPELNQTQSGTLYCRFTLAVDSGKDKNGENKADFIPCTVWKEKAEFFEKYVYKGDRVAVGGVLNSGSYEKDGKTISTLDVLVDSIFLLEPKKQDNANESAQPTNAVEGMKKVAEATRPQANDFEVNEDDLPF